MSSKTAIATKRWIKTPAHRDLVAIGVIAFESFVLMEVLELGTVLNQTAQRETWPIDKFITMPIIFALAVTFYAFSRLKERTAELREAKKMAETAGIIMNMGLFLGFISGSNSVGSSGGEGLSISKSSILSNSIPTSDSSLAFMVKGSHQKIFP